MNRKLMSVASAFALVANSLVVVGQNPVKEKEASQKHEIIIQRESQVISTGEPGEKPMFFSGSAGSAMPMFADGKGGNFSFQTNSSFATSQIHLDSKVVKGKPYSAEIVNEHIQTLGDGNRITRKSNSTVARDSEGRTRQESVLQAFGPFAEAMKDLPSHITIYDPVAGTTFLLNPKEKTAAKLPTIRMNFMESSRSDSPVTETRLMVRAAPASIEKAADPSIQRVSGGVLMKNAIRRVQPKYPATAKAAGAQGAVQVRVVVNEKGEVVTEDIVGGNPLLAEAAAEAAHQWKFQPTELNGTPVKVQGTITFNFTLSDSPGAPPAPPVPVAPATEGVQKTITATVTRSGNLNENQDIRTFITGKNYDKKTEPLGKQNLEGLECEGTRTVMTIPAGELGNDNPIRVVTETWISSDLNVTVLRKHNDPRFGEDIQRLTNVSRSEPSKDLFTVPADYKINEEGSMNIMRTIQLGSPSGEPAGTFHVEKRLENKTSKEQ